MINTNLTANTTAVKGLTALPETAAVATTGETAGILGGESLNVTTAVGGTATVPTIPVPVLAEAEENSGVVTDEIIANIEKAAEDLKALQEEAKAEEAKSTTSTTSTGSADTALVDIYQVMTLLLQIARKQREVARTARAADLQNTVAQIKAQAADQRSAAILSLGLSVALSAASLGLQMKSYLGQRTARANIQTAQHNTGLTQATQMTKLTTGAGNVTTANKQVEHLGRGLSGEQITAVNNQLGDVDALRETITTRTQDLDLLKNELSQSKSALNALKSEYAEKSVKAQNNVQQKYDLAGKNNNNVEAPELNLEGRKTNFNLPENQGQVKINNELNEIKARMMVMDAKVNELENTISTRETQLNDAKTNLTTALDEHLANIVGDGTHELTASQQYAVAKNLAIRQNAGLSDSVKELGNSTTQKQLVVKGELELSADYITAIGKQDKYQAMSGIVTTLSQMLGGVSQSTSSAVGAAATEREADAKQEEYQKQESDELASSAQELLNQVVQMLQQVNQIQNQSIESAIRA